MTELEKFASLFSEICDGDPENLSIDKARKIIQALNEFLYTTDDGLGTVNELGTEFAYFSEFHKYWEAHHKEILNLTIDDAACELVADALHDVYLRTDGKAFSEVWDTCGLSNEEVCRVRMLSANQDFRGSRKFSDLAETYRSDNTIFDERKIYDEPEEFVRSIGITSLSQNDKRTQYAKCISNFLIEHTSSPYKIIDRFGRDVYEFRNALINYPGAGYGNKKADMFIRDMVVLGIWENIAGFDKIDVASDVNTIKVALRTGILKSAIPLVSSFLDIFSYQYGYVDEKNALAWRKVWEKWSGKYPDESIASPCLLDFFVYNVVGRQFCKEILCIFECETHEHRFKWHSGRNKTCQECHRHGIRNHAEVLYKVMPCMDEDGSIAIKETDFYRSGMASPNVERCPFYKACASNGFKMLTPPKSISILGQTGWSTAYAKKGQGGGGLMA